MSNILLAALIIYLYVDRRSIFKACDDLLRKLRDENKALREENESIRRDLDRWTIYAKARNARVKELEGGTAEASAVPKCHESWVNRRYIE